MFIASFIPTCFSSAICVTVVSWVSNLNLLKSLPKYLLKIFAEARDQNLLHATFLKAGFPCNLSGEIYHEYS